MNCYEEKHVYNPHFPFKVQISRKPEKMYAHWHTQLELMYFYKTDGCVYSCRDTFFNVKSGGLVIANSAEVHACENFGAAEVCCITADADILGSYCGVAFENYIENDEKIHRIFEDIKAAFSEKSFSEFLYASDIYALLAVLLKKYMRRGISERAKKGRSTSCTAVTKAMYYVKDNLSENLSAERLSQTVNLSVGRFCHIFKEVTGITPLEYVEKERIFNAIQLLSETNTGISEIAQRCGFSDHSYFSHRFKKHTGTTPASYRNMHSADILQPTKY